MTARLITIPALISLGVRHPAFFSLAMLGIIFSAYLWRRREREKLSLPQSQTLDGVNSPAIFFFEEFSPAISTSGSGDATVPIFSQPTSFSFIVADGIHCGALASQRLSPYPDSKPLKSNCNNLFTFFFYWNRDFIVFINRNRDSVKENPFQQLL